MSQDVPSEEAFAAERTLRRAGLGSLVLGILGLPMAIVLGLGVVAMALLLAMDGLSTSRGEEMGALVIGGAVFLFYAAMSVGCIYAGSVAAKQPRALEGWSMASLITTLLEGCLALLLLLLGLVIFIESPGGDDSLLVLAIAVGGLMNVALRVAFWTWAYGVARRAAPAPQP